MFVTQHYPIRMNIMYCSRPVLYQALIVTPSVLGAFSRSMFRAAGGHVLYNRCTWLRLIRGSGLPVMRKLGEPERAVYSTASATRRTRIVVLTERTSRMIRTNLHDNQYNKNKTIQETIVRPRWVDSLLEIPVLNGTYSFMTANK